MMKTKSQNISSRASSVLAESSIRDLRQLRVDESDETVELSGHVRSYYHKQLAQETVRTFAQGRQLINRVRVSQ